MFLDESAFDVDEDMGGVPRLTSSATPKNQSGATEIKSGRYNNSTGKLAASCYHHSHTERNTYIAVAD